MSGVLEMEENLDLLIGEWHRFADQSRETIESQFASDGRELLERVITVAMGEVPTGDFSTSTEFAEYVLDLRDNEKAWSRRLGDVILLAQNCLEANDKEAARNTFDEFELNCPWKMFVDIARTQRLNTLG